MGVEPEGDSRPVLALGSEEVVAAHRSKEL